MHEAEPPAVSNWVRRFTMGLQRGSEVLDVACGAGRHFPLYLAAGCQVLGIDRDIAAAAARWSGVPGVTLLEADLETGSPPPFRGARYQAVVVTNYLWRPLLPDIVSAVAPDGRLVYETFMAGNERYGRPTNPNFLLQPQELLRAVQDRLQVIAFEQARLEGPVRLVQRIAAGGSNFFV